jgi:hypothetical protein
MGFYRCDEKMSVCSSVVKNVDCANNCGRCSLLKSAKAEKARVSGAGGRGGGEGEGGIQHMASKKTLLARSFFNLNLFSKKINF